MTADSQTGFCVIIPAYNEGRHVRQVVTDVLARTPNVVVVDDGSADNTVAEAEAGGATVLRHDVNQGKGAALETGFTHARERGYEFAIVMDADGQHAVEDLSAFIETYRRTGTPVLVGNRMAAPEGMPLVRRLTNQFMSWLLSRAMGQRVPDTQCGYRLFRCDVVPPLSPQARRFEAESEMLLDIAQAGVPIGAVPIRVIYGEEKSKINPVKDTVRFFRMLHRRRVRE